MLSQKGHSGAQAFLADLLWRGKYMKADPVRALALISVAVANAPAYERVWIEDIYQNIYCGAAQGIRKQATGIVADWRTRYGRKPDAQDHTGLGTLNMQATRTCGNGEPVLFDMTGSRRHVDCRGGTGQHRVARALRLQLVVPALPAQPDAGVPFVRVRWWAFAVSAPAPARRAPTP